MTRMSGYDKRELKLTNYNNLHSIHESNNTTFATKRYDTGARLQKLYAKSLRGGPAGKGTNDYL